MDEPSAYYLLIHQDGSADVTEEPQEVVNAINVAGARAYVFYGYEIQLEDETDESVDAPE